MCGISGLVVKTRSLSHEELDSEIRLITSEIAHRGPDGEGYYVSQDDGLALGHRRLSILELSELGAQPMKSLCDRYIISFNGEIYNYKDLRLKLLERGRTFRGSSDTEVLLLYIIEFGLEAALQDLFGMFTFAFFDSLSKELFLVRDRFGEKPLYYFHNDKSLIFGSELSVLQRSICVPKIICKKAVAQFFKLKYIPAPGTIYQNILKLPKNSYVKFHISKSEVKLVEQKEYFDFTEEYLNAQKDKDLSFDRSLANLNKVLRQVIEEYTSVDVEYGAFLSGGVDSSLICSIAQDVVKTKLKTFTIGFENKLYDESQFANKVAKHLDTDHHQMILGSDDLLEIVRCLSNVYSEPFADSSQIPTFAIAKFASKSVKVALTGDAGDEIFVGYNRYVYADKIWKLLNLAPQSFRERSHGVVGKLNPNWIESTKLTKKILPNVRYLSDKLSKLQNIYSCKSDIDLYSRLISSKYSLSTEDFDVLKLIKFDNRLSYVENMMFADMSLYLVDDILTKVDRASMSNGLECRVPFLDYRVMMASFNMPMKFKLNKNVGKYILKEMLNDYLPRDLFQRPKTGFSFPLGPWLRGDLRDWGEAVISSIRSPINDFIDVEKLHWCWQQHLKGVGSYEQEIWAALVLIEWFNNKHFKYV